MNRAIVAFAGDLHAGSSIGLQPPVIQLDDGQILRHSSEQAFIWQEWVAFWDAVGRAKEERNAPVVAFLNGETVDNNWHKTPQMATRNLADLMKLSLAALEPARRVADKIVVLRGTEAHAGGAGALDELVAERLGAVRDKNGNYSRWHFYGSVAGFYLDVCHHPGHNALRPWTHGGHVNRLAADLMHRYWKRDNPPELAIRGHVHTYADSAGNHPIRAVILPAWKLSAQDAWGSRFGGPSYLPIGGAWGFIEEGRLMEFQTWIRAWPVAYRQPETVD